jgi:hypothetical protein
MPACHARHQHDMPEIPPHALHASHRRREYRQEEEESFPFSSLLSLSKSEQQRAVYYGYNMSNMLRCCRRRHCQDEQPTGDELRLTQPYNANARQMRRRQQYRLINQQHRP